MKVILDTECWLWWRSDPDRLNARALDLFESRRHALCLSAASSWEIAIKVSLGKLRIPGSGQRFVPEALAEDGIDALVVNHAHALAVADLPPVHADPFDRLLLAQARVERCAILTADSAFTRYSGIEVIWASRDEPPARQERRSPRERA